MRFGEAPEIDGTGLRLHLISERSYMPVPTYDELFNPLLQATVSLVVQPPYRNRSGGRCRDPSG